MDPHNEKTPPVSSPSLAAQEGTGRGSKDQQGTFPDRLARYGQARKRAVANLVYLEHREPTDGKEAARLFKATTGLTGCGTWLRFRDYFTAGEVRLHKASFCRQHLLCPLCAIRRSSKAMGAYLERFEQIVAERPNLRPWLVTFTVQNGEDLGERMDHLRRSFRTLQDRRRLYLSQPHKNPYTELVQVAGAVYSYEVTNKGKGWHPHMHLVALVDQVHELDQQALRNEWERITGDSFMVDARPFQEGQEAAEGFAEVFKYALKFQDLEPADTWHAAETLRATRLLDSFGVFRGVQVPESLTDEPLDGLPFLELLYRYKHRAGYSLADSWIWEPKQGEQLGCESPSNTGAPPAPAPEPQPIAPIEHHQEELNPAFPLQLSAWVAEPRPPFLSTSDPWNQLTQSGAARRPAQRGEDGRSEPLTEHGRNTLPALPGDANASPGNAERRVIPASVLKGVQSPLDRSVLDEVQSAYTDVYRKRPQP